MSEEIEDMALRLASPAELREMIATLIRERDEALRVVNAKQERIERLHDTLDDRIDDRVFTLTRERDEARAEVERLLTHGDLEDELHQALSKADVPDHFVDPWDEADTSDRMSVQERIEALIKERDDARADAARLRGLIESTAEGLDRITACGEALRQGGPVPEDLDELSDGLHNAVTEAGGLVDEIRAALAGEGEVESLIPVDVDLLGLRLRATHPSPDDVGEAGSYQIMRLRTRRGEPILIDCGAGREIKITVRPSAGGATPEKARQP